MAKKKNDSSVFEIIVVLSIVAIVAFTGQVLIHYGRAGTATGTATGAFASNTATGFVTGGSSEENQPSARDTFLDVGVKDIIVDPPSPIVGEPFEVKVIIDNEGFVATTTPFYVKVEIVPVEGDAEPVVVSPIVTNYLAPGEESAVSFKIALITREGSFKIIATADSTAKLADQNTANNQRSKTLIISSQ